MSTEISVFFPQQPGFQSQGSFVQRLIEITVQLNQNPPNNQPITFAGTTSNTTTLDGSRTTVRVRNNGAAANNEADVEIYGLTPSLMNQLATLGQVYDSIQRNTISIKAGDAVNGMPVIFTGTIDYAYGDYGSAPDVPFRMHAITGLANSVVAVNPTSYVGPTDVATIMASFAKQLNLPFENSGVTYQLHSPYLPGNLEIQIKKVATDAGINAQKVDGGTKFAIWPIGGSRTAAAGQGALPLVSATTGMIGYPTFTNQGVIVKMLFNPQIAMGTTFQLQSSLPQANKTWVVWKLDLDLESLVPHGNWMATAFCYMLGLTAPTPPGA